MYSFLKRKFQDIYTISSGFISTMSKVILETSPTLDDKDHETGVYSAVEIARMSTSKEEIAELIASDVVVIFSKIKCPYCKMAKQVFDNLKKKYTTYELDDRDDSAEIQDILADMTGARTVPRVFVNGKCIGGGSDVKKLYDNGELVKML